MLKTLGGDRLHAGKKQQVELDEYGRSTHDLSFVFRTTASMGTIIPFACEVVLPGDEFDVEIDCRTLTGPTVGPVFGSAKVGCDIFTGDLRLYQGKLHNNLTGTGIKMKDIKLPVVELKPLWLPDVSTDFSTLDIDNANTNPSCILSYLGMRGAGVIVQADEPTVYPKRKFNAVPWLMYWDVVKNYYANKQEKKAYVIHTPPETLVQEVTEVVIDGNVIDPAPSSNGGESPNVNSLISITVGGTQPWNQVILNTSRGQVSVSDLEYLGTSGGQYNFKWDWNRYGASRIISWQYLDSRMLPAGPIKVQDFPLIDIDNMRESILGKAQSSAAWLLNDSAGAPDEALYPWKYILESEGQANTVTKPKMYSQEGLAVKTYMSDLFNNWLDTDWIDGVGGINELTRIDTSEGFIEIDTINFSEKLYELLNRIVMAGNTYDDYMDAAYTAKRFSRPEIPIYHGGLIKELVFQEVVSNAEAGDAEGTQPLGSLAGRGVLSQKHKGGNVSFKANEIGYMMGLVHVTPRLDYAQGNRWDTHLETVSDFHVPGLDEIGFQELIEEQMAWWTTYYVDGVWYTKSAGKQPAWTNYRTNVNRVFGNFAIRNNQDFMVFARKYKAVNEDTAIAIDDLTTYIDPAIYNNIFAQTSLDSQNLWIQISVNIKARRVMSTRVIPNL